MLEPPGTRFTVLGAAARLNPGVLMVRYTAVLDVRLPDVPVIVMVGVPGTAELLAESVRVLLPVVGLGENDAVTPLGNPEAARFTLPANPYALEKLTVDVLDAPGFIER